MDNVESGPVFFLKPQKIQQIDRRRSSKQMQPMSIACEFARDVLGISWEIACDYRVANLKQGGLASADAICPFCL